ncbi:phage minor structural, N-terminal region domain protein [Streptococcus oralis]|uniref:Phage minor structural, N-terminal region domain protein n=1 Tax=Streptococcus oralis TaxID=1303 RepID=A0A081R3D8_STROR|nr:phage tail spike protein [Streptococcus oralis]KEQ49711.1 phage minor structural, N-terminal region domain protein [Streptococcus oralis]QBX17497.1 hyaluronidase [Streptococcus phage Javan363]
MLYLLNKDVRTVRWNGEPLHEATSAIVKEIMNGDFTLTVKYPISDSGIHQLIKEDMLIKAPTPVLGAQLFRIKKPVEHNDHLEITAYHISDDVMQRSITPVSVTSQSCSMALSRMVQNTKTALGDFSFNSDIQDRRTFNTTETETLYSVLLDGKHSIVGTWEGELVRDNFAMTIKKSRGENRGVVITTHKNLKDYQRTSNSQNVVTRIHAKSTFKPEGAEKETTIRVTVDSPLINSYPYINEKEYENNNAKTVEELQKWAQAKFSNEGIDKVSDAIKIEAYELDGQVVHMGDTVNLKSWKHNVDAFKKAIAYEFDALKEEYISLTFDDKAGTGGSRASGGLSSAADAILGVTESAQEVALEKALQNADLDFDHKARLLRQEISDGIELAKARAEEVKRQLSDTIDQRFSSFNNGPLQEVKRRAEEALKNAGAGNLLAQEAKRISEQATADITKLKNEVVDGYVGKNTYQEGIRGIERRIEEVKTSTNGQIATQIAEYKQSVDGRFTSLSSQLDSKANLIDFQRVQETSKLYERIIGSTENDISNKVARMALTNQLFQVEVAKNVGDSRNYVKNADFREGSKSWKESNISGLNFNYEHSTKNRGKTGVHIYGTSINTRYFGLQQTFKIELKKSDKITLSFLVSKDGYNTFSGLDVGLHYRKDGAIKSQAWREIPNSDITASTYKKLNFNYELPVDIDEINLMFYGNPGKSINLYISEIKLETGSNATTFALAPEDTEEAVRTVQSQLAGSWVVQNINSAGDLISGLNLGANGHNRLDGKLTHITGETLIDNAVIKSAMIDKLKTANFEAGSVTTVVLDAEAVTAEKIKVDQAFFNKLVSNEAYLSQLFAKQAFINRVQSVAIDASQVRSGILSGDRIYGGTIRGANIFGGTLTGHTKIQLGSYGSFDTVNGGLQINVPRDYNAKDGLGVQFIGSNGRGEDVPYGLFIYKDSDFTTGGYANKSDDFLLTVAGYIKAKGIGWMRTEKGNVGDKPTATIGFWNSDNVSLSFGGSGNDIYYSYNGTAYSLWSIVNKYFSDRRLKENIINCQHKALDYIHQFKFKEYDWKKQEDRPQQAHTKIGLIAQEVQAVDSTLVYENGDTLNLDNLRLTNIALKAIQELALENQKLTHRVENLENERRTA